MKNRLTSRSGRAAASIAALVTTALVAAGPRAFAQEAKPGQPDIAITVAPFHDLGGAEYKGPDGRPLTERLVTALRQAIAESAKHTYHVADPTDANVVAKNATAFVVETEVTAIETGDSANRPYMLVSRLYREGKARKLVAQFAGNAHTLRDLTGNLMNQSSASSAGLIGGIGKQIVEAAENARPASEAFNDMVKAASVSHRVTVDVMNDASGKQEPRQAIGIGQKYRLRVNSQDPGAVYIVSIDLATKRPSTPYAQNEPLDVAPGQAVTLPPNDPFIAPKSATTLEYIVFVRKRGASKSADAGAPETTAPYAVGPSVTPIQVASLRDRGLLSMRVVARSIGGGGDQTDAIELLSSPFLKGAGGFDPGISQLLKEYGNDPEGSWLATRVKIVVGKSEGGEVGSPAPKG